MPTYMKDLAAAFDRKGEAGFLDACPHPVLVLLGLASSLEGGGGSEVTMMAGPSREELEVTSLVGRVFSVDKDGASAPVTVSIGRSGDADVRIPEYSISKRHCEVVLSAATITLRDCGSTNGTTVDGARLAPATDRTLVGGERVDIGRFAFRFDTPRTLLERLKATRPRR